MIELYTHIDYDKKAVLFNSKISKKKIVKLVYHPYVRTSIWLAAECFTNTITRLIYELRHEISNNEVCATSKFSDQPAHTHSLIRA